MQGRELVKATRERLLALIFIKWIGNKIVWPYALSTYLALTFGFRDLKGMGTED